MQPGDIEDYALSSGVSSVAPTVEAASTTADHPSKPENSGQDQAVKPGGLRFWLILLSLLVSTFLAALDLSSISNALPTIVEDLGGTSSFAWVGNALALGSTAVLPLTALQGVGAGGVQSMMAVVISDLVPLSKRGAYQGLVAATWAIASAIDMNLPLTGIAATLVWFFLHLKVPHVKFSDKVKRMDWIGNGLIMASTTATVIALTWGGTTHPWSSYQILVPLVLGLSGLVAFFVYEAKFASEPVVPWSLVSNWTGLMGYLATFFHGIISMAIFYYLPVYFQGAKGQKPVQSGVSVFGNVFTIAPMGIVAGISVRLTGWYKPQSTLAWALVIVGVGLLTLLDRESSKAKWVGFQIIEGIGLGIIYPITSFPVLAPIPVTQSGYALALWTFVRSYGQMWGITIGAAVLQNELKRRLPGDFLTLFPKQNVEIAYAAIPMINELGEAQRIAVQDAFAGSIRVIWLVMVGMAGAGFVTSVAMQQLKLHEATDEDWGMKEKPELDAEKGVGA
ncbi:hypothetical protein FRB90_001730 [Tulasnella sp. 427]|nr:hypothetical protein FRB90_001730 [Tulasnella sp. 427]